MDTGKDINSCIMLAMAFHTAIDLESVIENSDLKDTGIEKDPHVTVLYAPKIIIPKSEILESVDTILGPEDYEEFLGFLKNDKLFNVHEFFELGNFENDSDYLVLKLKKEGKLFKVLELMNKGLARKFGVTQTFPDYNPHLTLAELEPGTSRKYLDSKKIELILNTAQVGFEDLIISYGASNETDRIQWSLTTFHTVERYFRNQRNSQTEE